VARIALFRIGRLVANVAVHSRVEVGCLSRRPPLLDRPHRPPVGRTLYAAAVLSGAGKLEANVRLRGMRMVWVDDATDEGAVLAARGHRAIKDRKVEQGDFERDVAFEYFHRMPPGKLESQVAASAALDRIARTLVAATGRRSLDKTRRRVGELRREFLRLRV
jgi:hypothetical protein